jgi:mannose-6-phosphate isomerase-like protein (cupin superfamily)
MQRRKFLTTTLATATTSVVATAQTKTSTTKPFVVKKGEARSGIHTPYRGINPNDVKISGKDTNGQLAVFDYIGNEKAGVSLHVHHEQDEIFTIIEGEYLFQVGEGDTIFAPRKVPHTWVQLSEKGRMIYSFQPAGKMEEFFVAMSALQAPPTVAQIKALEEAHGMSSLGPGLSTN